MARDHKGDLLKQAASAASDRSFARFFDTAASELDLEIIGEAGIINMMHKILASVQVNYRNLPAILLEIDRTLKKYGARTVDELEAEQRRIEEENEAAEGEEGGEEGDGETEENGDDETIDDGKAFVKDEDG